MDFRVALRPALAGFVLLCGLAAAAPAQAPHLAVLTNIQHGAWSLRQPNPADAPRDICVSDPAVLLQLNHGGAQCSHLVITDTANSATVDYSCPGAGHGRTTLSMETSDIMHLHTQGMINGQPFDLNYEGHLTGACPVRR
jgi:hypothetical protein